MGEPAPLYRTDLAPVPPGAAAQWFSGADGARLRAALFPATGAARGSVVLSGGRTEPIEKYFEVIGELTARGFVVLCHDWRGQGLSQRLLSDPMRGHAAGYDHFLSDYDVLLTAFAGRLPKPWIAMGHSMGGCLTALVLAHGEGRFAAAALSAPMFAIYSGPVPPPVARALTGVMKGIGRGRAPMSAGAPPAAFEDNVLTHDPARYARNTQQIAAHAALALGPPTWGWLAFAFRAMAELQKGPGVTRVDIPVLILGAGADRVVNTATVREVAARFPKGRYAEAPGAFHEILQETDDIRAVFWREFDALAAEVAPQPAAA